MHMHDWITKLPGFLNLNDRNILTHAVKISHEMAKERAEGAYDQFNAQRIADADLAGGELERVIKKLPSAKHKRGKK